jgi:hypothetical protein
MLGKMILPRLPSNLIKLWRIYLRSCPLGHQLKIWRGKCKMPDGQV